MYEVVLTDVFGAWLESLRDMRAKARIRARIERVRLGNFGDWKPEGAEVRAMRVDYGPGYRLYYTIRENRTVFLLCGGDKRTQEADINKAREMAGEV